MYGVNETNPLQGKHPETKECVYWNDNRLDKITRCRFLSDPGCPVWDLSYCYGTLEDGTPVDVEVPFTQIKKRDGISKTILYWAKQDGVYAKGLNIFNAISTLN